MKGRRASRLARWLGWFRRRRERTMMGCCFHCQEPIEPGDCTVPIGGADGAHLMHRACLMRLIVGSVAHQQQRCSCHGGDEEDPPGLTRRQAAEAAYAYFRAQIGILGNKMMRGRA